jgi:mRNA interferase RelE/StbE
LSAKYKIAETDTFSRIIAKPEFKQLSQKLSNYVYPQLKENPFFGLNVKKLKGEYEGVYRYRVGSIRVFYLIDDSSRTVFLLDIQKRKDSYK